MKQNIIYCIYVIFRNIFVIYLYSFSYSDYKTSIEKGFLISAIFNNFSLN